MVVLTLGSGPRIENMKIVCQVCGTEGYLQHIGKNYYRIRHYTGFKNSKPVFEYHRLSVEYAENILNASIDHTGQNNIDPKILKSNPVDELEEGRSSSLVGRWLYEPKVAGSSPARPTN